MQAISGPVRRNVAGRIAVADAVKPTSAAAIGEFNKLGFAVTMLTGDRRATAESVARSVSIDRVIAGVLPEGKGNRHGGCTRSVLSPSRPKTRSSDRRCTRLMS